MANLEYSFPPFRLDLTNGCAWNGTQRIPLTGKAFALLSYLVRNPKRTISKEELLEAVWPGTFVSEAVLKVCVAEIRKALQDRPNEPRYIQTVHRQGYRFIGVNETSDGGRHGKASDPIERGAALGSLRKCLDQALEGHLQLVFVTGEAGIGKTTLVDAFLGDSKDSGRFCTAQGQCLQHHGVSEPYYVWLDVLMNISRQIDRRHFASMLRQHAPTWLAQLPSLMGDADREAVLRETLGAVKERMIREFGEMVEALAAETPLVIVLEDLHWSDFSTVDLLGHLAWRRPRLRLLVIGTYRPTDLILQRHPLKGLKHELQLHGRCVEIPLEFLSEVGIAEYIARRFPASSRPGRLAQILHRHTDGNPLFMVNALDYMVAKRLLTVTDGNCELAQNFGELEIGIPDNVQEMIEKQAERLSREEQAVLEAASVAGSEFYTAVIQRAVDMEPSTLDTLCENLAKRGQFIQFKGLNPLGNAGLSTRYKFIHELYQRAIYRTIAAGRRVQLHRIIAEDLERCFTSFSDNATEIAMHFEAGRDFERAIQYLIRLADIASRRYANREATTYLEHALELVELVPEDLQADLSRAVLEQRSMIKRSMDDLGGAAADLETLVYWARRYRRVDGEVRALMRLSGTLFWTDHVRCMEVAQRAVELSRGLDDPWLLSQASGYLASRQLRLSGWRDEDFQNCVEAVETARQAGDRDFLGTHIMSCALFHCCRSEYQAACVAADEGMDLAVATANSYQFISCQYFKAWALIHSGRWGEAIAIIRDGISLSEKNGHRTAAIFFRTVHAWLHIEAFQPVLAARIADEMLVETDAGFVRFLALIIQGRACAATGEYDRSLECFDKVRKHKFESPFVMDWAYQFPFHQGLCELWLGRGDCEMAAQEASRLADIAQASGERTYIGIAQQIQAETALRRGDWRQADNLIQRCLQHLNGHSLPLAEWRGRETAAAIARELGHHTQAEQSAARRNEVLQLLAESLEKTEPLRASVLRRTGPGVSINP